MCESCQGELIAKAGRWEDRRFLRGLLEWGGPQVFDINMNFLVASPGQPITIFADSSSGHVAMFTCV